MGRGKELTPARGINDIIDELTRYRGELTDDIVDQYLWGDPYRESGFTMPSGKIVLTAVGAMTVLATTFPIGHAHASELPAQAAPPSRNATIVELGDSLMVGRFSPGNEAGKLASNNIDLLGHDEKVSRPLVYVKCVQDAGSKACTDLGDGPTVLARMDEEVAAADVIFLALGTNTGEAALADQMDQVVRDAWTRSMRDGKPAAIVMPSMFHTSSKNIGPASERNEIMRAKEAQLRAEGIDIRVIDYQTPNFRLAGDGIHVSDYNQLSDYDIQVLVPIANEMRDKNSPAPIPTPASTLTPTPVQPVATAVTVEKPATDISINIDSLLAATPAAVEGFASPASSGLTSAVLRRSMHSGRILAGLDSIRSEASAALVAVVPDGATLPALSSAEIAAAAASAVTGVADASAPVSGFGMGVDVRLSDINFSALRQTIDSVPSDGLVTGQAMDYIALRPAASMDQTANAQLPVQAAPPPVVAVPAAAPVEVQHIHDGIAVPENTSGKPNGLFLLPLDPAGGISYHGGYGQDRGSYKHAGQDWSRGHPEGWTNVGSLVDGVVISVDHTTNPSRKAWGVNAIIETYMPPEVLEAQGIDDGDGFVYAQARELTNGSIPGDIQVGSTVAAGELIGGFGHNNTTGASEAPHVHINITEYDPRTDIEAAGEMTPGFTIDPALFGFRHPDGTLVQVDGEKLTDVSGTAGYPAEEISMQPADIVETVADTTDQAMAQNAASTTASGGLNFDIHEINFTALRSTDESGLVAASQDVPAARLASFAVGSATRPPASDVLDNASGSTGQGGDTAATTPPVSTNGGAGSADTPTTGNGKANNNNSSHEGANNDEVDVDIGSLYSGGWRDGDPAESQTDDTLATTAGTAVPDRLARNSDIATAGDAEAADDGQGSQDASTAAAEAQNDQQANQDTAAVAAPPTDAQATSEATVPPPAAPESGQDAPLRNIFTNDVVQQVLPGAPTENIDTYSPLILNALNEVGMADPQMACYAFATIAVETGGFAPIDEIGKGWHTKDGKKVLAKYAVPSSATGLSYYGRGFIQLTWEDGYKSMGDALGLDLWQNPELALDPTNAARILARYFKDHEGEIREAFANNDLRKLRIIVNGGTNHLNDFVAAWNICAGLALN